MTGHRVALLLALAALIVWKQQALGLGYETFGNTPDDPHRVYFYDVNGDARFYYKGDTTVLNAALVKFAAAGKGREIVLHAGPLKRTNLGGAKQIEAQWCVHVPGGISLSHYADGGLVTDKEPAVHIYLPSARVPATATAAKIAAWIVDLDNDAQKVRDEASRELEKQGQAAEVALRKALATSGSAEVKKRARVLLARLPLINLDALVIPAGLSVVGPDELVARCTKGLKSKEYVIRGVAAGALAGLEPDRKKAVEGLLKVLKDDGNEYVRRCIAGDLQREGWAARSALPELRKFVDDPDVNIKNAFRGAVAVLEKAKEDPGAEEREKLVVAVRKDIAAFLKARVAK